MSCRKLTGICGGCSSSQRYARARTNKKVSLPTTMSALRSNPVAKAASETADVKIGQGKLSQRGKRLVQAANRIIELAGSRRSPIATVFRGSILQLHVLCSVTGKSVKVISMRSYIHVNEPMRYLRSSKSCVRNQLAVSSNRQALSESSLDTTEKVTLTISVDVPNGRCGIKNGVANF